MELLMVTKNRRNGRGFRIKFGMTGLQFGIINAKFGLLLLLVLFFTSCSFYKDLRDNPVYKAGAVSYPQYISAIYGEQSTGCISLVWELVENASAYEIYYSRYSNSSNSFSNNLIDSNASLIYKYFIPYSQGKNAALEISNIPEGQNFFFIKSVSENGLKSDYSKKYISFYSYYSNSENLEFRELRDFDYEFNHTEETDEEDFDEVAFTIEYNDQWAAAVFELEDDWASIEVKFAADTDFSKIQFVLISDVVESIESWGPQYYSEYIPILSPIITINFEEWFEEFRYTGATKIVSANIQNKIEIDKEFSVKVIEAIVTKKDGSKIAVVPESDGWGSKVELN